MGVHGHSGLGLQTGLQDIHNTHLSDLQNCCQAKLKLNLSFFLFSRVWASSGSGALYRAPQLGNIYSRGTHVLDILNILVIINTIYSPPTYQQQKMIQFQINPKPELSCCQQPHGSRVMVGRWQLFKILEIVKLCT